jgi:hypothetical protein
MNEDQDMQDQEKKD